ncbi:MAG: response regulator [Polyangiaceae bacterium]
MTVRVLLVDDEPLFAQTLATLLRSRGCEVDVAHDCEEALERLRRAHAVGGFHVIVVDVEMPGRSGISLLAELCGAPSNPLVHVVSAYVSPIQPVAGVVWSKPVDLARLLAEVSSGRGARLTLDFVVTVAALTNQSWVFDVERREGSGTLWIGQGRVLGATLDSPSTESAQGGLLAMLQLARELDARVRVRSRANVSSLGPTEAIEESLHQVLLTVKAHRGRLESAQRGGRTEPPEQFVRADEFESNGSF